METDELLDQLERDGRLLTAAAAGAGWDTPVPGLEWSVRQVVAHTGAVHRWAADIVARGAVTNETGGSAAFHAEVDDDGLVAWFEAGLAVLLETLRAAPEELEAFTFLRGEPPRRFWIRRQAHETAIHRADVEAAAGAVTPFDAAFAQDGVAEIVEGFGRGRGFAVDLPCVLALVATDGDSRLVTFGGERTLVERTTDTTHADAAVTGASSELYLWAWNRPSAARVSGDRAVAGLWRRVRIE